MPCLQGGGKAGLGRLVRSSLESHATLFVDQSAKYEFESRNTTHASVGTLSRLSRLHLQSLAPTNPIRAITII
jgi:hypothetical protein